MKKCLSDGTIVDMSNDEIAENQKALLETLKHDSFSNDDLISLILADKTIALPSGETKPVSEIAGTSIDLPLKVGYKWELVTSGNNFAYQLVQVSGAIGTAENPIIYYDGVEKIDNAFYLRDGVTLVYMSGQFVEL